MVTSRYKVFNMQQEIRGNSCSDNSYGLACIQKNLLMALDVFDYICKEFKIKYSLHGGTLLGAERNHHLIPWDDDIDVSMRRSDFEILRKALDCDWLKKDFYLDDSTTWVSRFVVRNISSPVYIDIFIWDYISEYKIPRFLKINILRFIQGMIKDNIDYKEYSLEERVLLFITNSIGNFLCLKTKIDLYHFVEQKMFLGHKLYIHRSNDSFRGIMYVHDKNYMESYQNIELEGNSYLVNDRYHEFLVAEYGLSYLIPPSDKDRYPKHETRRKIQE